MASLGVEINKPQIDGDHSIIVIERQAQEIRKLTAKVKRLDKKLIEFRGWYGDLWDILDELNAGDIDVSDALNRWLEYGMGGKNK